MTGAFVLACLLASFGFVYWAFRQVASDIVHKVAEAQDHDAPQGPKKAL